MLSKLCMVVLQSAVIGALLLVAPGGSTAQDKKNPYKAVSKGDRNGDGKIGLDEWKRSPEIFKKIDKDQDGFLSPEDFAKHWGQPLKKPSKKKGTGNLKDTRVWN